MNTVDGHKSSLFIKGLCARFGRSERASIALMFALMLPVLFGIVGLGVEVGIWFKERRELQTIADAAAVSAAIENTYGATSAELTAAATLEANNNGFDATTDAITYVGTPTSGTFAGDSAYIEVIVTRQLETILSQVFYSLSPTTTVRAVAGTTGDQEACVLALSPTAMNSVYVNGAGTTVSMDGCSVVANSDHSTKAINVQNGSLEADCLWTVGGINGEANITTDCGSNISGASQVDDPYADLNVEPYAGCLDTNYTSTNGDLLLPGVYCGGIRVNSGDTVTMSAGTYILDEGDFHISGGGSITGNGVTIILTASDGTGTGSLQLTGGATIDLSAPTSGSYAGILVYQDRDAGSSPSLDSNVTGGTEVELGGAIYLPENDISFSGGNTADSNGCLLLIAQTVSFNGSADIENDCDMYGGNPATYGARPGLVE